jgi:hypothetical protein
MDPLLDLKQKYASVFEARYAREQAVSTSRQGHTIMVFTIVTILFVSLPSTLLLQLKSTNRVTVKLPMSFMAAFFAINVKEFPHAEDSTLRLNWVLKYTRKLVPINKRCNGHD